MNNKKGKTGEQQATRQKNRVASSEQSETGTEHRKVICNLSTAGLIKGTASIKEKAVRGGQVAVRSNKRAT